MKTPANYSRGPHTAADYGRVSMAPPPSVIYRRNQMRRFAFEVIGCVICLVLLIGFAMTPEHLVVQSQAWVQP